MRRRDTLLRRLIRATCAGTIAGAVGLALVPSGAEAQDAGDTYRLVPEPAEVVVEVGGMVPLEVRTYDMEGNPVELELVFSAPRTGLHVREGEVRGRQVGHYAIHVAIMTPDAPRRVPASIYVEDPPPGMPRGPQPVLEIPVRVIWPEVQEVEIVDAPGQVFVGAPTRLRATARHADGSERVGAEVRWSASGDAEAHINRHGVLEAHTPGALTLTAEVEGARTTSVVEVLPFPGERVVVEAPLEEARTGDVLHFRSRVLGRGEVEVSGVPVSWSYNFIPHDSVFARGASASVEDGAFVAEVPGTYTVNAVAGPLVGRATVEIHPRGVLHRAHEVGRGPVIHTNTHDFWVFEGVDGRDYAITGTSGGTAYIWDVTDPSSIVATDSIQLDARQVNDVKVSPDSRYAVLSREGASNRINGVVILDLENPRNPTIASEFTDQLTGGVHNVWPMDDYLYALSGGQRYVIIDMEDIYNPRVVGSYNHPNSSIHDVIVHDGIAYSSEWENGIVVVDVGNGRWGGTPEEPVFVTQVIFPEMLTHTIWPYHQESTGKFYLFASDELWPRVGAPLEGFADLSPFNPQTGEGGRPAHTGGYVHIIDFTDVDNPQKVARYQMDEYGTHNPWVEDDILYQGYYEGGLRIVDVSGELRGDLRAQGREMVVFKPYDPQGYIANAPMVWGAQPHKGYIFFSDANSGLWSIRIEPREGRPIF